MRIPFRKMHGLGNDFVILDGRVDELPAITQAAAAALADRHTGIGCDQLIVLEPSDTADFRMRIFNADGGEVEACGNAARAVARYSPDPVRVETGGGIIALEPFEGGARVNMGVPRFALSDIPMEEVRDAKGLQDRWPGLPVPEMVNVGNPHAVFFVDDLSSLPLAELGPRVETDPLFSQRVNVNFARVKGPDRIELIVWERGAGFTRACGTGACATAVAGIRRSFVRSPVTVSLPGGSLEIEWDGEGPVFMSGPAVESFRGSFAWDDFA